MAIIVIEFPNTLIMLMATDKKVNNGTLIVNPESTVVVFVSIAVGGLIGMIFSFE